MIIDNNIITDILGATPSHPMQHTTMVGLEPTITNLELVILPLNYIVSPTLPLVFD